MKLGFCRGFPGAGVVSSRYREKYRQKYTLRYRQDCENGWLRELSSQGISSQLSNFPIFQDANFLASWLQILIFEFSRILEFSLWFWSLRRERNSLARSSLVRALLFPLCPLCSTLPGSRLEGTRPHRFGREGAEGQREPCPLCFWRAKNPPGLGWVCSLEVGRQVIDDDDIDPVGRSRRSVGHTGGVITSRSGGICNGVHLNLAKQFRNLFRGSASALLHASGSPAEEAAVSRCSRNVRPSNGLIPGGQPGGGFWFCVRLPRIRWVASPPVSHSLLELTQSFLRFFGY